MTPKKTANPQPTENVIVWKCLYFKRDTPVIIAEAAPSKISTEKSMLVTVPFVRACNAVRALGEKTGSNN